jgi:ElaB/YqjD/DUF883 family membrane-anchored ribosome-binding protein
MAMASKEAQSGSGSLSESLDRGVDEVTVSAHDRVEQISAARPAVDRLAANAHDVIDTVAEAATSAVHTLAIKGDQLNNAQGKLVEAARGYVRERPITSLGIAVVAGWVLSRLLR